jgi:hypothetical protein
MEKKGNHMTTLESTEVATESTSRRGFAKAAVGAVAVAGFGAAALKGVLASQGGDGSGTVSVERRRRRRRRSGGRNSGGRNSGGRNSGGSSGGGNSGGGSSGDDD